MARLQISVLSCYPTVTVRGKANVTVCAVFCFSQLGSWVWCLKVFASGCFRRSYATGIVSFIRARKTERHSQRLSIDSYYAGYGFKNLRRKDDRRLFCYVTSWLLCWGY